MKRLLVTTCAVSASIFFYSVALAGQVCTCHMSGRCDEFDVCTEGLARDWCIRPGAVNDCENFCTHVQPFDYGSSRHDAAQCNSSSERISSAGPSQTHLRPDQYVQDSAGCEHVVVSTGNNTLQLVQLKGRDGKPLCIPFDH